MNGKVKELLKSYNVPNNVIDIVEGYYNDMLQSVIVEYEKNNKQQQEQPKKEKKAVNIAELAAEHRIIK